jgi:hypothetical protein
VWVSGAGCVNLRLMSLPLSAMLMVNRERHAVLAAGLGGGVGVTAIVQGRVGRRVVLMRPPSLCVCERGNRAAGRLETALQTAPIPGRGV